jgi:hypothetical protein
VAEVLLNGLDNRLRVVEQDSLEGGQAFLTLFEARVRVTEVRVPLKLKNALGLVLDDLDAACRNPSPASLSRANVHFCPIQQESPWKARQLE